MNQPVVRPYGQASKPQWALVNGGERTKGDIALSGAPGEVTGQGLEGVTLVEGPVEAVGPHVQDVLLVAGEVNGRLPIPAQRGFTQGVLGMQTCPVSRFAVGAAVPSELIAGVHRFVVARIYLDAHAVSTVEPVVGIVAGLVPTGTFFIAARPAPCAIVLQAAIDAVGCGVVYGNGVELSNSG